MKNHFPVLLLLLLLLVFCGNQEAALMNHTSSLPLPQYLPHPFDHSNSLLIPPSSFCFCCFVITAFLGLAFRIWLHLGLHQTCTKDPQTWPLLGSHAEAVRNFHRLHDWLLTYFSDDHRTVRLKIFSHCTYLTVDPANVEYILKTNFRNYPKGEFVRLRLHDFLGDGIFNADGEIWKQHRKIASVEFSSKKLREFSTTAFREDALKLAAILDNAAKLRHAIDLHDLLMRMTLDSICKVGFGVDMGSLAPSFPPVPFGKAFDNVNQIISTRPLNPFWQLQKVLNVGREKILRQEMATLNKFTSDVIRKRKAEIEAAKRLGNSEMMTEDLLSRFISFNSGKMGAYSDQALRDAILNFVIAGRDTTASTLAWFIYCVCNEPEVAERVAQETREVLGLKSTEQCSLKEVANRITYDSLSRMHYLHAALTETLRLYPAVPRDRKEVLEDDILPDGTRVKRGDQVGYVPYSMGRMEFLWGKDALEFKPDRWLKDGVFRQESPFKFTAFQGGPRVCLGKDAAYVQMKMTAALLLQKWRFRVVAGHHVTYRVMMVLSMGQGGLPVLVSPCFPQHSS